MSKQAVLCFIDILGFARMVTEDAASGSAARHVTKLRSVVSSIRAVVARQQFEIHQFSDSIIICATYSPGNVISLIDSVSESQYLASCAGVLVRGAIALGQHDSDEVLLYSEALVAAYRLENARARYPRIVVDENVIILLRGTTQEITPSQRLQGRLLRDRDHAIFVNYLRSRELVSHEQAIHALLADTDISDPTIFEKYDWLSRYHNFEARRAGVGETCFGLPELTDFS